MPYREPSPPSRQQRRTVVYGPFRLAEVRVAIVAVLGIAIAGSLAQTVRHARLTCSRAGQSCELRILEGGYLTSGTLRFPVGRLEDTVVESSWMIGDRNKTYIPELRLAGEAVRLFEVDQQTSERFLATIGDFVNDPAQRSLSLEIGGTWGDDTWVQLVLFCPIFVIFFISARRAGSGVIRLSIDGDQLTVPRRLRWRRARRYPVAAIAGVDVERHGLKGRLTLLMKGGRDQFVTDRAFSATRPEAHDEAANALRVALRCPVMPDLPLDDPNATLRRSPTRAFFGALGGVFLGAALTAACDLWRTFGVRASVSTIASCLAIGILTGLLIGLRRR